MLSLKTIRQMTAAAIIRYPARRAEYEGLLATELERRAAVAQRRRLRALGQAAGEFIKRNI